jgi:hypothetical protein
MSRITVAEAKGTLCRAVDNGVPADDPRVLQRLNEAMERLMVSGHYVGMTQELTICTMQQCFTLPRQIESVQEIFILDQSLDVNDGWYSVENPATYVDPDFLNDVVLVDRGEHPTIFDICTPGKLIVYSQFTEAAGDMIRILGLDTTGNEIYTMQNGVYAPGELIALSISGTVSVNTYSKITDMQKPVTNGPVRIYEVDPNNASNHIMLAILDPSERVPSYRRYFCNDIPVIEAGDPPVRIRVTGKRRYLPVTQDTDFLILSNVSALRLEMMSLEREDGNDFQGSAEFHKRAQDLLTAEAKIYQQDPTRVSYRKAQCLEDEKSYDRSQLGYVRARLALENPQFLRVGLRTITRAINTSQERLISQGYWKNTVIYLTLQILGDGWIVPPPNIESIVVTLIEGFPLTMRNRWFESHEATVSKKSRFSSPSISCIDRGTGPTFFDIIQPTNIQVGSTQVEAADVGVTIYGTDHEGNWVQTVDAVTGIVTPGEYVAVNATSHTLFGNITRIKKTLSVGSIILWAYGQTLASIPPLMIYPSFRRYFIPGLGDNPLPFGACVEAQCKLKYAPAWNPEDFLVVSNYPALKEMVFAVANEEAQKLDIAGAHELKAIKILNDELRAHRSSATGTMNIQMRGWLKGWRYRQPL